MEIGRTLKAFPGEVEAGSPSGNATNENLRAKIRLGGTDLDPSS
jgi:hypothetical protein